MCGRTRCTLRADDVGVACGFRGPLRTLDSDRYTPSYNVSPGRYMPVVRNARGPQAGDSAKGDSVEPIVHCMKWGLVPSFSKKNEKPDHFRMFNARSESVHLKPSFCRLVPKSRCVTTVEGFYEWKKDGAKKQPYYVHFKDGRPLVFAGLYDSWKDEEGNVLYTFTILTTRSSKALDWLHDRMPVILPDQAAVNSWLNDDLQESSLRKMTQPYEAPDLVWYPVTPAMGKPSFDSPECVKEMKPKVASDSKIAKLFGKKSSDTDANVEHENLAPHSADGRQIPENETPASIPRTQDEDSLTEYDKKSLLAGMEYEHQMAIVSGDVKSHDSKSISNSEKFEVSPEKLTGKSKMQTRSSSKEGQTQLSSQVKQSQKKSPSAKRQRLAVSRQTVNKKGELRPSQEKQSNLLSFLGKS
ncbi:unnamed protein product [Calypogeia fissa]